MTEFDLPPNTVVIDTLCSPLSRKLKPEVEQWCNENLAAFRLLFVAGRMLITHNGGTNVALITTHAAIQIDNDEECTLFIMRWNPQVW